jgi:SPP1 gp7 family putative phage head morphogenesis protein
MARDAGQVPPVRPNAGLEQAYRRRLERQIDQMQASLVYWISAAYRANRPEMASDESPAMAMRKAMRVLTRRWSKGFAKVAQEYGTGFVKSAAAQADRSWQTNLKKAGFTVRFKLTPPVNDVIQASVGENVTLIKSIASEHLAEVEGLVMRSVQSGRDLGALTQQLEARYAITRRRASTIARDQNNKTTSAINRVRQLELGVKEGIWMHSAGGKTPRPSHVAYSGKRFDLTKGAHIDGKWIFPGEEINCRCVWRAVLPGFD